MFFSWDKNNYGNKTISFDSYRDNCNEINTNTTYYRNFTLENIRNKSSLKRKENASVKRTPKNKGFQQNTATWNLISNYKNKDLSISINN